jgi:hypothetical protein
LEFGVALQRVVMFHTNKQKEKSFSILDKQCKNEKEPPFFRTHNCTLFTS